VLINERDLQRRVDRVVGDIVQDADLAPPADIVILHRVICCYPDAAGMMTAACMHAGDRIALTVPRNALWIRLGFAVMNAWLRLRRVAFRAYVHEPQQLFDTATAHGFGLTGHTAGLLWQCAILRRQDSSPSA
jgi:magnesium-protoporphyrin O-methyltransferase